MVKLNTETEGVQLEHCGDPITVAAELAQAAGAIYNAYKTKSKLAAEFFRSAIQHTLEDNSPAWEPAEGYTCVAIKKSGAPTDQS